MNISDRIAELSSILPPFSRYLIQGYRIPLKAKLSLSEERTLMFIQKKEGCQMSDYSSQLTLEKGSFTAIAKNLEKKGLIKRTEVYGDKRKNALLLTEQGRELTSELETAFRERIAEKLSSLSPDDLMELEKAIVSITGIFDKMKEKEQNKCQN